MQSVKIQWPVSHNVGWCDVCCCCCTLIHWGRDKMAAISQTTFSNAFCSVHMNRFFIKTAVKFVPKGAINNILALVQVMAWRRKGDKPLSEPRMVRLPTHMCVTRAQWVNTLRPRQNIHHFADDIFKCILLNEKVWVSLKIPLNFVHKVRINNIIALVQIMAWCHEPLSEPLIVSVLTHVCVLDLNELNLHQRYTEVVFAISGGEWTELCRSHKKNAWC